jgi:outer membrane protein
MYTIPRALLGTTALLLLAAPLAAQAPSVPQRFGYVDTRVILDAAPGRTEAEAVLQKEAAGWQAEVNKMQDQMNSMIAEFQKGQAAMTPAARDKRTKELQDKQAEFQKRNDDINTEAERRRAEVLQPILDQIKLALEDVRVAMGLDVIFDVGQNATLVAVNKNLNLSDRVIARLRVLGAPAVAAKASTPSTAAPAGSPLTRPSGLPVSSPAGIGRPTAPVKPDSTVPKKPESTPLAA